MTISPVSDQVGQFVKEGYNLRTKISSETERLFAKKVLIHCDDIKKMRSDTTLFQKLKANTNTI